MNRSASPDGWRCVATIELDNSEQSHLNIVKIVPSWMRVQEVGSSLPSHRQYDVMIEEGPLRNLDPAVVTDIVATLALSSPMFPSFRIVKGNEWLERPK
jgi:hypothetical protein